jgi:membrane protein implicated in regulation of membrane protease activity
MDNELWRWLWLGLATVLGIGEVLTAGFFLLPFVIGAGMAALVAWLGIAPLAQWLVFFGISLLSWALLHRYIKTQDSDGQPRVGANRWEGATGLVLEEIDPVSGKGMVRVSGEEWRATVEDGQENIPIGNAIEVIGVVGTRLVVVPRS